MRYRRTFALTAIATALMLALPNVALAASGDRDTSFGGDGMSSVDIVPPDGFEIAYSVALSGKKTVIAGTVRLSGGDSDIGLARFNKHGAPDPTFGGGDGFVVTDLGGDESVDHGLAVLSNGKILVSGYTEVDNLYQVFLVRYNANGTPDMSFGGGDAMVVSNFGQYGATGYELLVLPDGRIIVAGSVYPNDEEGNVALWRFSANGVLDTGFGVGGTATTDLGPGYDEVWRMLRTSDGKLLVGGWVQVGNGDYDVMLARFNGNGTLDTTFGFDGSVSHNPTSENSEYVNGMAISGNKIIVCIPGDGPADRDLIVMRLKMNGARDRTFDGDGEVAVDFGADEVANDCAVQSDGKIVLAGDQGAEMIVARLLPDGGKDMGFGVAGMMTAAEPGAAYSVVLRGNGRIVVSGQDSDGDFAAARFLP